MDKISFGLKDGKIVDISEVESGRNCNCVCPNCKRPLIAAKGEKNTHHFKHDKNDEDKHCVESVLHIAAKDIFKKYSNTVFPVVYLFRKNEYKRRMKFYGKQEIKYDKVEIEVQEENFIPDVKLITNDNEIYFIEIAVTHKIDYQKYLKLKQRDVSTIEINLGKLYKSLKTNKQALTVKQLESYIINNIDNRYWVYNKERNDFYEFMKSNYCEVKTTNEVVYKTPFVSDDTEIALNFLGISPYNEWFYVDNCPLKKAQFQKGIKTGKYYANVKKDCSKCMYCVDIEYDLRTNDKKMFDYKAPEKVYCIYQPNKIFKDLMLNFSKNITTIHGNKKVEIKQRKNIIQGRLFD